MNPERLVAGLDIGTSRTTAIIAEVVGDLPKHPNLKVLGVGQARTSGLRRGVVADIEETTRSITKAMQDAERMAGVTVDHVYAGIAGEHVQAMTSSGVVAVNGDDVTRADVERANEVARTQAIPADRELLHAIPQEYRVDKNHGIRDPIGMVGMRLETEMYLVTIGASPATNLRRAVERAGYHVRELVSSRWRAHPACSPTTKRSWASRSSRWERARRISPCSTRARSGSSAPSASAAAT